MKNILTLRSYRNGTSKCFSGLLLSGVSYYKMYYGLLESKLSIILAKYISLERSVSRFHIWWNFVIGYLVFFYRYNIEREIDRFVPEMHKKIKWSLDGSRWLFLV